VTRAGQRLEKLLPALYLVGVVWINAYVCRQAFFIQYTGKMHSMHGFWMAMARLAGDAWYKPTWWPYWFGGMPFEFTYAPGVPWLTAAIWRVAGVAVPQAFNIVCALIYCFGPVALFWMAWRLTGRRGWSFLAAVVYSLAAPSELVTPDAAFRLVHLGDARRLYLTFVWDEAPHQLALALVTLAILFFARAFQTRERGSWLGAILCAAGALLSNAFGATDLAIALLCLLATCETVNWKRNAGVVLVCGTLSYLLVCPFLPPSLLEAIRANGELFPETAFTAASLVSLAGVLAGGFLLWWISRRWRAWHMRFFLLLAWSFTTIPLLLKRGLHFVPQGGRYKVEVELAIALLLVFAIAPWIDRLPRVARLVLLAGFLALAARQLIAERRYAKAVIQPAEISETIEYQMAQWTETNLPGRRVLAPGSIAQWMNAFSRVPQLSGGSYPTAPTTVGQIAMWGLLGADDRSGELATVWLRVYGVDAVIVSGPKSPEFWKPFQGKQQFEGLLPKLWVNRDTTVYDVPRRNRSLAWVIPEASAVQVAPRNLFDDAGIRRYVVALEDPSMPTAEFTWRDANHVTVRATVAPGNVLSVQVTYHPGWKAIAGGRAAPIRSDGLGQMIVYPQCAGACEIEMVYDGGREAKLCRALSLLALLGILIAQIRRRL